MLFVVVVGGDAGVGMRAGIEAGVGVGMSGLSRKMIGLGA